MTRRHKYCPDCEKLICSKSQKCASCVKKGKNNPMWGRRHSKESRRKMSENLPSGSNHYLWRGGRRQTLANIAHQIWEKYWHQLVPKNYVVHHVDRKRENNNIANLALMTKSFHGILHSKELYQRMEIDELGRFIKRKIR